MLTLAAGVFSTGCSSPRAGQDDSAGGSNDQRSHLAATLERMANAETGLELRTWALIDQPARLQNALMSNADDWRLPAADADKLRRNGMRMLRIPSGQLPQVRDELEPLVGAADAWHGNAFQWRSVHHVELTEGSTTAAIDGRVMRFSDGQFQLLARCWTLPTEDGPRVQLELVPQFDRNRTGDYRTILGEKRSTGRHFPSLALDARLEPGFAYVLTVALPEEVWEPSPDSAAHSDQQGRRSTAYGPDSMIGPGAPTPPTIGELLLSDATGSAARQVLLFVPRVPDSLQPRDSLASNETRGVP